MNCNIYFSKNQIYVSLNLINFRFNDILDLFEMANEKLIKFGKTNRLIFDNNIGKYLFVKSGDLLSSLLESLKFNDPNDIIIFESGTELYYTSINYKVFELIEGLLSQMDIKGNISVSQRALNFLTDKQILDE